MAKSKRVKPANVKPLKSTQEVDGALFRIAQFKLHLKRIDADAEEAINNIKERAAKESHDIQEEIITLENSILAFSEYHKNELFDKNKSIELNFGFIGYRKSSKITIKKTTVDKLKAMDLLDAIVVKETTNKDVLKTYADAILKQVDARRVTEEKFWYEVKEEEITKKTSQEKVA